MSATRTESMFRLSYAVSAEIAAPAERVWALLTDADAQNRWNSTLTRLEGPIALGQKLSIQVPLSDRIFTPRVTAFEPHHRMVWADGMAPMFKGVRTFTLTPTEGGCTFTMEETFAGIMLPMIKGSLPDFTAAFDTYAADLRSAAEA